MIWIQRLTTYVARVPVPGGRVHEPVSGTRTGYLGTRRVRLLPYPILGLRTQDSVVKKGVLIGEMVRRTPCLGTSYPMFGYLRGTIDSIKCNSLEKM